MSDDIPMWLCPVCEDLNAVGLEVCRCREQRPSAYSIRFIEANSPLGKELLELSTPSAANRAKSPSKGKKEAVKKEPKQPEELELEERFHQYWLESNTGYTLTRQHRGIVKHVNKKGKVVLTNHRFDFALPSHFLAIEIQGGIFNRGRHVRPQGYHDDRVKIRKASMQGWTVWEFTTIDLKQNNLHNVVSEILAKIQQIEGLETRIAA